MTLEATPPVLQKAQKSASQGLSASQRAYEALRAGILNGDFEPGDFIEESVACDLTKVSRTPVREALARLRAEGYLVLHPRRGAMVKPISTRELFELYEVRLMVETHAARKICRDKRAVSPDLYENCEAHKTIPIGDHLAYAELNRQFHEGVVAAAGNMVLLQVFQNLRANLTRVAMLSFHMGVNPEVEAGQHIDLLAALEAHDEDAAVAVVERHLMRMPRLVAALPSEAGGKTKP